MHHTATRCTTLQHASPHCNTDFPAFSKLRLSNVVLLLSKRQHTTTHCTTLHHTTTHHNTPQHTAPHCTTLQHAAPHCNTYLPAASKLRLNNIVLLLSKRQHTTNTAPHYATLHHTTTHYTTLHQTAPHCTTLHHTAPHCTTLHHTAPQCITLHHTAPHCNLHFPAISKLLLSSI